MARLKELYKAEVAPALMKQFGYKSVMQIPKIDKVVINVGCGEARENANAFDGRGNYALGIKEQLIFPEIEYDKIDKIRGMDIIIVTTAQTDEEGRALLQQVGAPFAR